MSFRPEASGYFGIYIIQTFYTVSLIIEKEITDKLNLKYSFISSWITLTIHSALEAVGLTASFSKALSEKN
ncbi:MAG: hypothetical protein RL542_460 [Bacteroidota bacterium]|jgi:hypothetical protein